MSINILDSILGNWNNISVEFSMALGAIWLATAVFRLVSIVRAHRKKPATVIPMTALRAQPDLQKTPAHAA